MLDHRETKSQSYIESALCTAVLHNSRANSTVLNLTRGYVFN